MRADPHAQLRLLELQSLDSRADQLRHQRDHLPEHQEISALQAARLLLVDRRRDVQIVVDDLAVEQAKVEADVGAVRARQTRDQDRMDRGLITRPEDLERMQGELVSLQRRIGLRLDDEELEVMLRVDEAQADMTTLTGEIEVADARLAELITARDEKAGALDAELATVGAERDPVLPDVPADLMALYTRLRESKGGVGAALLRARACGGCRLTLDNAELATIAAAADDLVVRCEECSRILVRTAESGL